MRSLRVFMILGTVLATGLISCEKCKKCSYTYTVTSIEQTVNGEQEVVNTYTGYVVVDSVTLADECIKKGESFTIEQHYIDKGDTTVLDNYEYTCIDV